MRAVRSLFLVALVLGAASVSAQTLPSDAQQSCTGSINSWFQGGSVTLNGIVNPANSITFQPANNCNFYLWSQQMLLWLLSPSPSTYGGSGRVFDSPVFYQVSTLNSAGKRVFIPQLPLTPGATMSQKARRVGLRPSKPGPNGLPAVVDRQGRVIELLAQQTGPSRRPVLFNQGGTKVEVGKVIVGENRRAIFHDAKGNVIPQPKLIVPPKLRNARVGQRFFTPDLVPIIVGPDGIIFDVEPGQAGGNAVLLAQNQSVVYYSILANDVYAWFASGVNSGGISATMFPTTQAELNTIQTYAGQTFPDGVALTVEIKLSWVDISAVSNPSAYITTPAIVPVYNTSNPTQWTLTGEKLTTLALVGIHFVGSVNGHPEMVWSTFEHFGNSPNAGYQYVNSSGATISVPANSSGTWLFSTSGSTGPFNNLMATYNSTSNPPAINVEPPNPKIVASDTQRINPFGVFPGRTPPNQEDTTVAAANTEVISVNNSVLGQLAQGDVRANYYLVGSTWTFGGYGPTGPYTSSNSGNGAEIGTNQLANSTMETYHQGTTSAAGLNCFACHTSASGAKATTAVSHIFSVMQPLAKASAATAKPKPRTTMKKQ